VQDLPCAKRHLVAIATVVEAVDGERVRFLLQLKHSSKYRERVAAQLQQALDTARKQQALIDSLARKKAEHVHTIASGAPRKAALIAQTKTLQKWAEQTLSAQYKGRPVKLTGELNLL